MCLGLRAPWATHFCTKKSASSCDDSAVRFACMPHAIPGRGSASGSDRFVQTEFHGWSANQCKGLQNLAEPGRQHEPVLQNGSEHLEIPRSRTTFDRVRGLRPASHLAALAVRKACVQTGQQAAITPFICRCVRRGKVQFNDAQTPHRRRAKPGTPIGMSCCNDCSDEIAGSHPNDGIGSEN